MLQPEDEKEVQVTHLDQSNINEFSNLTSKIGIMEQEHASLVEEKEYLDELMEELELSEEDSLVNMKIGDSFVEMPLEEAREALEKNLADIIDKLTLSKAKIDATNAKMSALKTALYAKFGNTIHLEKD